MIKRRLDDVASQSAARHFLARDFMSRGLVSLSVLSLGLVLTLGACQTTQQQTPAQGDTASSETAQADTTTSATTAQTAAVNPTAAPLVFEDSFGFDWDLSTQLREADGTVSIETPEGVLLTAIPERLDMWLSRVKDNGGVVKAQAVQDADDPKTRSLLVGAFIDVVLYLLGIAKEEVTYGPADDYDAFLYYNDDTGQVKEIIFKKRTDS